MGLGLIEGSPQLLLARAVRRQGHDDCLPVAERIHSRSQADDAACPGVVLIGRLGIDGGRPGKSAHENLSQAQFFHVTRHEFQPGEVVLINESDLAERAEFVPTARVMEVEALVEGSEINPLSQPAVSVGRELPLVPDGQVKGSAKPVLAPGRRYSPQRSPGRTFPQDSCSSAPAGGGIRGSRTSANADSCPGAAT